MKAVVLVALIAIAGSAVAAEAVSVKMLRSGVTLSMSDDGQRTYIDGAKDSSGASLPIVFERKTMGEKQMRNYKVDADGRLVFDGVIRRADVILDGERVEVSRL